MTAATTRPRRIQRQRTKGWKRPLTAVIVDRTSRFGNPFTVGMDATDRAHATALYREWLENNSYDVHPPGVPIEYRQEMDRRRDWIITHADRLKGRDLVCWCPLPADGEPDHCHASVLITLANQPAVVEAQR
jgi:Domain of unknown function (DUF4326)